MNEPNWELQSLSSEDWGPSPLEDIVNIWLKLLALNLVNIEKPKLYYISTEYLDSSLNVFTVTFPDGIKVSIFHPSIKDSLLTHAVENGWEPVDYQEYCKTEEWFDLYGKHSLDKLTKDLITRVSK